MQRKTEEMEQLKYPKGSLRGKECVGLTLHVG